MQALSKTIKRKRQWKCEVNYLNPIVNILSKVGKREERKINKLIGRNS